ncbi:MAG: ATP-binding protein [Sediminibacterium sp.]|nr:ATP-binding protein [Sediminibacterium sp.]
MHAILFCGIQATGKSSFYKQQFFKTHMHLSLDVLKTRHREGKFLETCLKTQMPFVIDNTNVSIAERKVYIDLARLHGYKISGYYFQSKISDALLRNSTRTGKEYIPETGIKGAFNRLELPTHNEGFDELFYVKLTEDGFITTPWDTE